MTRSNYSEDVDNWALIRWRGRVASAIRGKRGQALLRDMLVALDAMEPKRLIAEELVTVDGDVCALGALARARGIEDRVQALDPTDSDAVAAVFDIASPLAREIVYVNDEGWCLSPEQRWKDVRSWVASQIKAPAAEAEGRS